MFGCSPSADAQSGSGTSVADSKPSAATTSSTPGPAATDAPAPAPAVAADPTPIPDRKPKNGDEVAVMTTSMGKIVLMFFPDKAPKTVANFKTLAKKGFYDGTKFHRVIPGFMIQGGDPNTKTNAQDTWGTGGPGYTIPDEFSDIQHVPGILSMANTGSPNSGGSQFFIMVAKYPSLDGHYSAFGKVVSGQSVADKIVAVPTEAGTDRPVNPPKIISVKIEKWPIK